MKGKNDDLKPILKEIRDYCRKNDTRFYYDFLSRLPNIVFSKFITTDILLKHNFSVKEVNYRVISNHYDIKDNRFYEELFNKFSKNIQKNKFNEPILYHFYNEISKINRDRNARPSERFYKLYTKRIINRWG
jgi:hypothetical protein